MLALGVVVLHGDAVVVDDAAAVAARRVDADARRDLLDLAVGPAERDRVGPPVSGRHALRPAPTDRVGHGEHHEIGGELETGRGDPPGRRRELDRADLDVTLGGPPERRPTGHPRGMGEKLPQPRVEIGLPVGARLEVEVGVDGVSR